jgi:hypothetical protein
LRHHEVVQGELPKVESSVQPAQQCLGAGGHGLRSTAFLSQNRIVSMSKTAPLEGPFSVSRLIHPMLPSLVLLVDFQISVVSLTSLFSPVM